jgi:ferredoxin/thioredoxin reductase
VLQADVDRILALDGVETRFGHRVTCDDQGRPPLEGQAQGKQEFAAWLWASGAGRRRPSSWPDAEGIVTAWSVLAGDDDQWPVAGPVFVLGATATAVAAARRLARLGQQQVVLVSGYPGTRWPVDAEDLAAAVDEGVSLRDRWNLDEAVVEGGRLVAVAGRATRTAAGRAPRPEGVVQHLPATRLVVLEQREAELPQELSSSSSSVADGLAYQTSLPGIFAAGEAVTGPKTVVEAIAAGKGAALSIDGFLWGRQPPQPERRRSWAELVQVGRPWQPGGAPQAAPGQVEIAAAEAVTEARRCLRCGPCADCDHCDPACPHERVLGVDAEGPIVYRAPAGCAAATDVLAARVDEALCTGCGRCEGSCPHHAVVVAFRLGGMVLAQVDRPACRGCGRCVASCPFGAIELNQGLWDREQLWRQIAEQRRAR